jgi:membrane-associated phospholipid phosphatase
MPSLHFGWDLLVGVALFTSTTVLPLRIFALTMPSLMAFSVVATANHWILDVLVGLLVVSTAVALCEAGSVLKRRRRRARFIAREPLRESS